MGTNFDAFDVAELNPVAELFPHGTSVCVGEDGVFHRCEHDGCAFASLVSLKPAMAIGMAPEDEEGNPLPNMKLQYLALSGRLMVPCSAPIKRRQWVCADGKGSVRPIGPREREAHALGYALADSEHGQVGLFLRNR